LAWRRKTGGISAGATRATRAGTSTVRCSLRVPTTTASKSMIFLYYIATTNVVRKFKDAARKVSPLINLNSKNRIS
jgi:hypothetical protein